MSHIPLSIQRFTPTTGQTITVSASEANIVHVIIEPAGLLATLTITMPTPIANQKFIFTSTQAITVVSVTGSLFSIGSFAASGCIGFIYFTGTSLWYKIQ